MDQRELIFTRSDYLPTVLSPSVILGVTIQSPISTTVHHLSFRPYLMCLIVDFYRMRRELEPISAYTANI